MDTIFNNAVKAGAVVLAVVAVGAMLVAALNRLWSEAAIFAGGTVPPLWFLWRHRRTQGRSRSGDVRSRRGHRRLGPPAG